MSSTIGIIGPGGIGGEVAKLAINAGMQVVLSNSRGPNSLKEQVAALGPNALAAAFETTARMADIVILATPLRAGTALPVESLAGKIVIDMMNYYPVREGQIAALDESKLTSSEMVQRHFVSARVVKALNNQDAPHLLINATPGTLERRTTLPVAGDDEDAKKIVSEFLFQIGYASVDAGSLAESWRMEPGSPIYVWPYAPAVPASLNEQEANTFYVNTCGEPVSAERARELLANAKRPERVGGFPEELPSAWTRVVGRYADVLRPTQKTHKSSRHSETREG